MPLCVKLEYAAPASTGPAVPTMPAGPKPTSGHSAGSANCRQQRLVHVRERGCAVPSVDQAAVFQRACIQSEAGAHHSFAIAKRIGHAHPRLNVSKRRRIHLADDLEVARRGQKIDVVAHAEARERKVGAHSPLVLNIETAPACARRPLHRQLRAPVHPVRRRSRFPRAESAAEPGCQNPPASAGKETRQRFRAKVAERAGAEEALRTEDADARREVWASALKTRSAQTPRQF
jgi:hypothetical protein